jgi:hypothetical protein
MGSAAYLIGFFAGRIEILILTHGVMYGVYMIIVKRCVIQHVYNLFSVQNLVIYPLSNGYITRFSTENSI